MEIIKIQLKSHERNSTESELTYGMGISIWTSLNSRLRLCSSYSTLTSQLLPPSFGQQLTVNTEQVRSCLAIELKHNSSTAALFISG